MPLPLYFNDVSIFMATPLWWVAQYSLGCLADTVAQPDVTSEQRLWPTLPKPGLFRRNHPLPNPGQWSLSAFAPLTRLRAEEHPWIWQTQAPARCLSPSTWWQNWSGSRGKR